MKNIIITIIIVAVITFTAGLYLGDVYGGGIVAKVSLEEKGDYKNTFEDGWRAAKEKLEKSGFFGANMGEIKTLSGDIESVGGNKIVVNTNLLNPLDDESLKTRTVTLTNDTKITVYRQKTTEEQENMKKNADNKLESLRPQRNDLEEKMKPCHPIAPAIPEEGAEDNADCVEIRSEYEKISMEIVELEMGGMDVHKKIDNAKISDIKKGYSIFVISDEDISSSKEIKAVAVEAREAFAPGGAGVAPGLAPEELLAPAE